MGKPEAQIRQSLVEGDGGEGSHGPGPAELEKHPFVSGVGWVDPKLQAKLERGEPVGRLERSAAGPRVITPMPGVLVMANWRVMVGWKDRPVPRADAAPKKPSVEATTPVTPPASARSQSETPSEPAAPSPRPAAATAAGPRPEAAAPRPDPRPVPSRSEQTLAPSSQPSTIRPGPGTEARPGPQQSVAPSPRPAPTPVASPAEPAPAPSRQPSAPSPPPEPAARPEPQRPAARSPSTIEPVKPAAPEEPKAPVQPVVEAPSSPSSAAAGAQPAGQGDEPQDGGGARVVLSPEVLASVPNFYRTEVRPEHGFEARELYILQRMIGRFTLKQLIAMRLGMNDGELGDLLAKALTFGPRSF
ncbi:MAG: hypothetical protein CMH55_08925 [Myxococcales bacterium]|nr:hypothetical protein [Myxococcales bacterium]